METKTKNELRVNHIYKTAQNMGTAYHKISQIFPLKTARTTVPHDSPPHSKESKTQRLNVDLGISQAFADAHRKRIYQI